MRRLIFTLLLLLCFRMAAISQKNSFTPERLIAQYNTCKTDTGKILLLLQIDSFYLWFMPSKPHILDSAYLLATQARQWSKALNFAHGYRNATFNQGRILAIQNKMQEAISLTNETSGELATRLLMMLGEHYLFKFGASSSDLDSAYYFGIKAKNNSEKDHDTLSTYEALLFLGKCYYTSGDIKKGTDCFMQMVNYYHRLHNIWSEAHWWDQMATYLPDNDSTYHLKIYANDTAQKLYQVAGDFANQASMFDNLSDVYLRHKNLDLAKDAAFKEISIKKKIGKENFWFAFSKLAIIHLQNGNYDSSLYYSLNSINNMDSIGEIQYKGVICYLLGYVYSEIGKTNESLAWFHTSLNTLVAYRSRFLFQVCKGIVSGLLKEGKPNEALTFLNNFLRENGALRYIDKEMMAASLGDCYQALGRNESAEKQYLQMISFDDKAKDEVAHDIQSDFLVKTIIGSEAYSLIGNFYIHNGQFAKAEPYLRKALISDIFSPPLSRLRDIHGMLFKVDSAKGNYVDAIRDLQVQQQLNDSIFSIKKSKAIQELQIKYETEAKDEDLRLKQKDITLLTKKSQLQQANLKKASLTRNIIILSGIALLILFFAGYEIKQRHNVALQKQQNKINEQNHQLETAVAKQKKLSKEKDWLIKEIHHRVKNNLQIVISLLNVQSDYLDNPSAINAIQESRERMQAIALIHQKLYQTDFGNSINIKSYIEEMLGYLQSFTDSEKVRFDLAIGDLNLDVSQAVPLGLILNEAITNALKYAFINNGAGTISIELHQTNEENIFLKIRDSGKGFPENFNFAENKSLGIQLMKLFAEQLDGELSFENNNGGQIQFIFKKKLPIDPISFSDTNDGQFD